jgi:predicted RNase H-like HicB family nuclease
VKKYLIILEKTNTGYSAYSPDLPGCASTGDSREEVEANMREAVQFHIDGFKQEGCEVPEPSTLHQPNTDCSYVHVAA